VLLLSEHPEHLEAARSLLEEFLRLPDAWARFGGVPTRLPDALEREIVSFPGAAAPPGGDVVVSLAEGEVVAAGHLLPWEGEACEVKRLYVQSRHRCQGVGTRVARTLIDRARSLGYHRILLDVMPERVGAVRLWRSLGFRPCPPYRAYPFPMDSMEKDLGPDS
jgi:putative acetyltransferase